jgi:uncharacterized protein YndB with AHSA1/START domain
MTNQETLIEREIHIDARRETVFAFFTDPEKLARWKGQQATLDARPGGVFEIVFNEQDIVQGEYVEIIPHERLVFTWGWVGETSPLPPGSSRVEISLIAVGMTLGVIRSARRGRGL